jgi:hypothetical protein
MVRQRADCARKREQVRETGRLCRAAQTFNVSFIRLDETAAVGTAAELFSLRLVRQA